MDREALLRKVDFPRLAVPLSAVLTALLNVALNLIAVLVFLIVAGGDDPLDLARAAVPDRAPSRSSRPASGCCSRALFVRYRDIKPIWEVVAADPLLRLADLLSDRHRHRPQRAGWRGS